MEPLFAGVFICMILSYLDAVTIYSIQGSTATLPCGLGSSSVVWRGPYETLTIYAESDKLNKNLPKDLYDRLKITFDTDGKSLLWIVNVQFADSGEYVCSDDSSLEHNSLLHVPELLCSSEPAYYRSLLVDSENEKLIVGSMNSVSIIDISSTITIPAKQISKELRPETSDHDYCILSKSEKPYCQNHIRIIAKKSADILVLCGTNADAPRGFELNMTDLSLHPIGRVPCSNDPFSNFTAIYSLPFKFMANDHIYFGATNNGDSAISRQVYNADGTVNDDVKGVISNIWMKDPQFAGSFDIGDKVYFFFRELAVEVDPAEPKLYSRVAKVCKEDTGGNSLLRNKWTSYQKAKLSCEIPGVFPVCFDAIQDIVTKDNEVFYGLFTTQGNMQASAICAFNIADIESVFNGPFKEQTSPNSYWTEATNLPSPRPGQCTNDSLSQSNEVLQFIVDHPLMHQSVQPLYGKPIFVLDDEDLQQLELHSNMTELVFYAASNAGKIYKLFTKDGQTYISSNYTTGNTEDIIWSLKQHGDFVYVGTDNSVKQIKVVNCQQHCLFENCVKDPHCGWVTEKRGTQYYDECISRSSLNAKPYLTNVLTHENVNLTNITQYEYPPATPTGLSVIYTWETKLRLRWIPDNRDGTCQYFVLEYRTNGSYSWKHYDIDHIGSVWDPQYFDISDLRQGSLYEVRVFAKNLAGLSSSTDIIIVGTASKDAGQTLVEANTTVQNSLITACAIQAGILCGIVIYIWFRKFVSSSQRAKICHCGEKNSEGNDTVLKDVPRKVQLETFTSAGTECELPPLRESLKPVSNDQIPELAIHTNCEGKDEDENNQNESFEKIITRRNWIGNRQQKRNSVKPLSIMKLSHPKSKK